MLIYDLAEPYCDNCRQRLEPDRAAVCRDCLPQLATGWIHSDPWRDGFVTEEEHRLNVIERLNRGQSIDTGEQSLRKSMANLPRSAVFDIETGPLPEEQLLEVIPPFDPDKVSPGNRTKQDSIDKHIEEERQKYLPKMMEKAAINPCFGRVLAIGMLSPEGHEGIGWSSLGEDAEAREYRLLEWWWDRVGNMLADGTELIGCNIHDFDLPFLLIRSWKYEIEPPEGVIAGRYWNPLFIDLLDRWGGGANRNRFASPGGLDGMARFFGLAGKLGSGKDFARLVEIDFKAAEEYLRRDLQITLEVAQKMNVIRD